MNQIKYDSVSAQELYCHGLDCFKRRDFDSALGYFDRALALNPQDMNIWDKHHLTLVELGRHYEAEVSKNRAHRLFYSSCQPGATVPAVLTSGNSVEYWVDVANQAYLHHDYASEAEAYMAALEVQPDSHTLWYSLGIALRNLKKYDLALNAYQNSLQIEPNFHLAWHGLGNIYREKQQCYRAIDSYKKALQIEPNFHYAWHGLGNALIDLSEYVEAIKAYEKAISIDPQYHLSWYGLGNALRSLKCHKQAIFAYDRVIGLQRHFWRAWVAKGAALADRQDYLGAIAVWQNGLTHAKEIADYEGCADLYWQIGYHHYLYCKQGKDRHNHWLKAQENYAQALEYLAKTDHKKRYQELQDQYHAILEDYDVVGVDNYETLLPLAS